MNEVVREFLRNTGRVVSVVIYTIAASPMQDQEMVLMSHRFVEIANSAHRFDTTKTWTLFKDYKVPSEWGGMHPKWVRVLSRGFLFREK